MTYIIGTIHSDHDNSLVIKITISQISVHQFRKKMYRTSSTPWRRLHCDVHLCSLSFAIFMFSRWPALILFISATAMGHRKAITNDKKNSFAGGKSKTLNVDNFVPTWSWKTLKIFRHIYSSRSVHFRGLLIWQNWLGGTKLNFPSKK